MPCRVSSRAGTRELEKNIGFSSRPNHTLTCFASAHFSFHLQRLWLDSSATPYLYDPFTAWYFSLTSHPPLLLSLALILLLLLTATPLPGNLLSGGPPLRVSHLHFEPGHIFIHHKLSVLFFPCFLFPCIVLLGCLGWAWSGFCNASTSLAHI